MDNVDEDDKLVESVYKKNYFKVPKWFQQAGGLWPYDADNFNKRIRQFIIYTLFGLLFISLINGCRIWCGVDFPICCENIMGTIYVIMIVIKFYITIVSRDKLKVVIRKVAQNWKITDLEERQIILKYARIGEIKSLGYCVYMIVTLLVFSFAPLIPAFLDLIKPLNQSREKIMILKAEFMMDPNENYYKIHIFVCLCGVSSLLIFCGIDGSYTTIVHQNIAMLGVVKHRLHKATKAISVQMKRDYDLLVKAVLLHKKSVEFNDLIEGAYSLFFLSVMVATVIFLSFGAVVTLKRFDNSDFVELLRGSLVECGGLIHLFYLSWPGQMFLDISDELYVSAYTNEWYNISPKAKKILRILMLRLTRPIVISAGGLYIMNFQNYGSILKTAVSYIAVAVSF